MIDILIFGGQSNMQGQTEALSSTEVIPDAYEYKYLTNDIVPLRNPVGEDIRYDKTAGYCYQDGLDAGEWLNTHVTGGACYGHTNLVPEFCRAYTETTGRRALAVHVAKGSTVIADWLPGTPGYEIICEKVSAAAVRAGELVGHIFFAWLQGESDAIEGNSKAYYKEKISEFCGAMKKDIGLEKFGMIRVGRFTNDDRDLEIIAAQDEICAEHEDFLMLTDIATELNTQSEYMNPFVGGHYGAKGLEKLGFEAGKTLGSFYK